MTAERFREVLALSKANRVSLRRLLSGERLHIDERQRIDAVLSPTERAWVVRLLREQRAA